LHEQTGCHGLAACAHPADGGAIVDDGAFRGRGRRQAHTRAVWIDRLTLDADAAGARDSDLGGQRARIQP